MDSFTPRPLYPLNRSLDGLQSRSGRSGGEENLLPSPRVHHAVPRSKGYFGHVRKGTEWELKVFLQLGVPQCALNVSGTDHVCSFAGRLMTSGIVTWTLPCITLACHSGTSTPQCVLSCGSVSATVKRKFRQDDFDTRSKGQPTSIRDAPGSILFSAGRSVILRFSRFCPAPPYNWRGSASVEPRSLCLRSCKTILHKLCYCPTVCSVRHCQCQWINSKTYVQCQLRANLNATHIFFFKCWAATRMYVEVKMFIAVFNTRL